MEAITRLVSESLARHGFDRPLDYRRLHWSRWFRCESLHSLLSVPSKPGVFAVAEEVMNLPTTTSHAGADHVGADAPVRPAEQRSAVASTRRTPATTTEGKSAQTDRTPEDGTEEHRAVEGPRANECTEEDRAAGILDRDSNANRRMLAVTQFFEDDDMAFVLDRMLTRQNPLRARLLTGSYFVRFVVIEDQSQRRSICAALNQWIANSGEKISGIGAHFASAPDLSASKPRVAAGDPPAPTTAHGTPDAFVRPASEASAPNIAVSLPAAPISISAAPHLDSGAATNIHCPQPLPSGF